LSLGGANDIEFNPAFVLVAFDAFGGFVRLHTVTRTAGMVRPLYYWWMLVLVG
jgi:hypothetical protein